MPIPIAYGVGASAWTFTSALLSFGRVVVISAALYFSGEALNEVTENIQETVTPTSPLPEGREETSFSIPTSISIALLVLATAYLYDKVIGKSIFKKYGKKKKR